MISDATFQSFPTLIQFRVIRTEHDRAAGADVAELLIDCLVAQKPAQFPSEGIALFATKKGRG